MAVLAAAITAAVPAAASARHHARRHAVRQAAGMGGCRLDVNVAPRFIEAGESTVVFGLLACPAGVSVAEQPVTIYSRPAGGPPAGAVGSATTDATGHYQFPTAALTVNTQFYAVAGAVRSGHRAVKVSPKITLGGPADGSQLFTGGGPFIRAHLRRQGLTNRVVFSGAVSPEDTGAVVALQRESSVGNEEWRRIGWSRVGQGGTYSITHTFAVPGEANIRVVVRSHGTNAVGASESLSYEISQMQNPALKIESSADPISYGQPTTISGTISAPGGTTLTLLSRNRLQRDFTPVATTTSNGDGSYAFPVQTPLQSTFYKVTGGGKMSSRLFEGVRYGLTDSASAGSVQAGTPLTVSGTVTPGHEGHPVYLQVQNGTGIGFHTVEVTQVHGSAYSLTHTLYAAGARKLRVKVPGDPENQGVASAPFAVEVTPAPAAALTPEAPGNSTQPSEGHF
ncbi:MAG TPA: hypothetical protein VL988_14695 [Solirubrobacteraceae bacterium]|nr:hypothetical protein [Solirubrobacteraceae bacterium]